MTNPQKFRIFSQATTSSSALTALLTQIEAYVTENNLAPKSISIQEAASNNTIYATLGYRDDQGAQRVRFEIRELGTIERLGGNLEQLQLAVSQASNSIGSGIVCQDLCTTPTGEFVMVWMVQSATASAGGGARATS